ncbi:MAG: hypothetical protein V7L13_23895 [Nostoc sp.]|uniref:hypothetical protein n=1 Tax=Nostoc sp. TaxID=1180 RepID=UPI002FF7D90E
MGYFADTPLAKVNNAYKSQILNRITNSPGVKFIKENYPEIQQFLKDNSPVKVSYDDCNIIINDIFGTYSYRNPLCTAKENPSSLPSLPEPWSGETIIPNPPALCDFGIWLNVTGAESYIQELSVNGGEPLLYTRQAFLDVTSWTYPVKENKIINNNRVADLMIEATFKVSDTTNTRYMRVFRTGGDSLQPVATNWEGWGGIVGDLEDDDAIWTLNNSCKWRFWFATSFSGLPVAERISNNNLPRFSGLPYAQKVSKSFYENQINNVDIFDGSNPPDINRAVSIDRWFFICGDGAPTSPPSPPPPPPPPKKKDKCCMCCEGQQNNDALLKLVLKRIGSLPASVPDNFTKQHPSMISIESLAELMLWQMQQIDALLGAYPIELKIEDNDLTKEGDQEEKIALPNMAEAIAELLGLLITVKRDTHATLITAIKAMGEAGMAKNLGVKTLDVTLANAEFLGYKLEQKKKEVPSLFTPGGKDITETLIEKNVEIITYENTDKKDLQDDLKFLKTMAARWNAQNWRQVTGDPVESLKQTLFGNPEAIGEVHGEKKQGDFNDFTEQAERGFIEVSGITDSINPWGRPYSQRPKIREIGTEKGNYDNDGKEKVS